MVEAACKDQQPKEPESQQVPNRRRSCLRRTKTFIVVATFLAMVFSILIVSHCNFVTTETHVLGLFNAAQFDEEGNMLGCISIYDDGVQLDGLYKNAKAFGTLTALLVTAAFLLLLFVLTLWPNQLYWKMIRFMITASTMSSMFVFTILGSSYCSRADCKLSGVGILNVFNVFLLASISVALYIDKPPEHPMFTVWSDDLFTVNKDTLVVEHVGSFPEFFSHEDAERLAETNAAPCTDIIEMEIVNGQPQLVHGSRSVFSEQPSIQESLMTTINVQRSRCFRYMILFMIILTWALTIFSIRRCTFVMVSATADPSQKFGMGVFARAVYHEGNMLGCLAYPEDVLDEFSGAFKASRVFGTIAALLMSFVLVCGVLQLFTTIAKDVVWFVIRGMVSASVLFQGLVFLIFKTSVCEENEEIECSVGGAAMITVVNCLLLLGLAVLSCVVPPPANPVFVRWRFHKDVVEEKGIADYQRKAYLDQGSPTRSKLSMVQEVEEGDGDRELNRDIPQDRGPEFITVRVEFGPNEKKTVKEITHSDGSKTITTMLEDMLDVSTEEDDESTIASVFNATDDISLNLDPDVENVQIVL